MPNLIPEYKCPFMDAPYAPYILAAWEKLNQTMIVPENFSFDRFERLEGTDAILLHGDAMVPSKGKSKWKPSGTFKQAVVVTRREVNEFVARQEAPPVDQEEAVKRIRAKGELLIAEANELGVVVVIENRPTYPLTQGKYTLELDVRARR